MKKNVDIKVSADRQFAWHQGGSVRFLVVDVIGTAQENEGSENRLPLNLALVIDRSGSMNGQPIEAAKEAAKGVIEMMTDDDLLTVVCFNNRVRTIVGSLVMDKQGREEAKNRIATIHPGGTTDLEAGWLTGAEHVAENMQVGSNFRNYVVLLSDGHANQGETNPDILGEYASGLQSRGIISTTVGIGDGYSPEILQAIAENGGGRMHDAEYPDEIVEVVTAELDEISHVIADNLKLDIRIPDSCQVDILSSLSLRKKGHRDYSCLLGALGSNRSRQFIFKAKLPSGEQGEELKFSFTVSWSYEGKDESIASHAVIRLVSGKENSAQQRDMETSKSVAAIWQAKLIRKITEINVRRDYQLLQELQENEFHYFRKYCLELPWGPDMVSKVERLLRRARRPMRERSRKEMTLAAYKQSACEPDYRSNPRGSWDSYLDD